MLNRQCNKVLMALGRINVNVDDKLEQEFRLDVAKRLGYKKGSLNQALEEAIRDWIHKGKGKEK